MLRFNLIKWLILLVYTPLFILFYIQITYDMWKLIGYFVSLFLILIIFLRIPQENVGLASFATKSNLLGSPSSAQRSLNILTACGILIYLIVALNLNAGMSH